MGIKEKFHQAQVLGYEFARLVPLSLLKPHATHPGLFENSAHAVWHQPAQWATARSLQSASWAATMHSEFCLICGTSYFLLYIQSPLRESCWTYCMSDMALLCLVSNTVSFVLSSIVFTLSWFGVCLIPKPVTFCLLLPTLLRIHIVLQVGLFEKESPWPPFQGGLCLQWAEWSPPQGVHVLIPGTWEYVTWQGKRPFVGMIKIMNLEKEDYSGLSGPKVITKVLIKGR